MSDRREAPMTMHAPLLLKQAIKNVAERESLPASTWFLRLAKAHPDIAAELERLRSK